MVKLRQLKNPLLKVGKVGFGLGPLRGLGVYHKFPVVTTGICGNTSRFQDADPRLPLPLRTHDPKAQGGEPVRRGAMKQLFYEALGLRFRSRSRRGLCVEFSLWSSTSHHHWILEIKSSIFPWILPLSNGFSGCSTRGFSSDRTLGVVRWNSVFPAHGR